MVTRKFFSVILNLVAVFVPAVVLFRMFGLDAKVDPESIRHLFALLGTAFFSFAVGLGSAALLRSSDRPFILTVLEDLMRRVGEPGPLHDKEAQRKAA